MRQFSVVLVFLISTLLLAACSTTSTTFTETRSQAPMEATQALDMLEQMSPRHSRDTALAWAREYLQLQQPDNAQAVLNTVEKDDLSSHQKLAWYKTQAQTYLGLGQHRQAIILLDDTELARLLSTQSAQTAAEYLLLQADAYALNDEYDNSLSFRFNIASDLSQPDQQYNNEFIWALLMQLSPTELEPYLNASDSNTKGWAELAHIHQDTSIGLAGQAHALTEWQNKWPHHPAASNLPDTMANLASADLQQPNQIAVLLPESGPLARAALAIHDGILTAANTARYRGELVPEIRFYDTSVNDIEDVITAATLDGANFIIGPLEKDKVDRLAESFSSPVTTLVLNYANNDAYAPNFYQFGLAPEDEAKQIAHLAHQAGLRGAGLLIPASSLGQRLAEAFTETWHELGGEVVAQEVYGADYSNSVSRLMGLSSQAARAKGSRHRAGLDMIFLVGNPEQARQLKPAIDFFQGNRLPIYANSQVHSGQVDIHLDTDLNRIQFVELPWMLKPNKELLAEARNISPHSHGKFEAVFALGIDAFTLSRELVFMSETPDSKIVGQTGELRLNNNRITRVLQPAQFQRGHAIPMEQPTTTVPSYSYDAAPAENNWPSR